MGAAGQGCRSDGKIISCWLQASFGKVAFPSASEESISNQFG